MRDGGASFDPARRSFFAPQDKRLNIWSIASGKHVRAYKVEAPLDPQALNTGKTGVPGLAGGVSGDSGKGDTGGELFKVDLDPTGMYAAACSFDKVGTMADEVHAGLPFTCSHGVMVMEVTQQCMAASPTNM